MFRPSSNRTHCRKFSRPPLLFVRVTVIPRSFCAVILRPPISPRVRPQTTHVTAGRSDWKSDKFFSVFGMVDFTGSTRAGRSESFRFDNCQIYATVILVPGTRDKVSYRATLQEQQRLQRSCAIPVCARTKSAWPSHHSICPSW